MPGQLHRVAHEELRAGGAALVALGWLLAVGGTGCSSGTGPSADGPAGSSGGDAAAGHPGAGDAGGSAGGGGASAGGGGASNDAGRSDAADAGQIDVAAGGDAAPDAGDARPLGACLGVCLESFTSACPKVVGCTSAMAGGQTNICYANGVKDQRNLDSNMFSGTVKKADGSLCYRWTRTSTTQDYIDLNGNMVAEVVNGATDLLYTVSCGAAPLMEVFLGKDECAVTYAVIKQTCTPGSCTF